jgi:GntR family transcriptional repressor for pyruvate dehydrogenase complex
MRITLRRDSLADQVAHHLLDFIDEHALGPGDALPSEAKLTQEFGVSRPIIREALCTLEARGVIEITNGKGATVKPVGGEVMRDFFHRAVRLRPQTLVELLEVRRGVEIQSAVLAARRRTDEDVARLTVTLQAMGRHLVDVDAYTTLDADLHLCIAAASHNTMLYHLIESLRGPLQETIRAGYNRSSLADKETLMPLHGDIVAAIRCADADMAARAMASHFDGAILTLVGDAQRVGEP